MTRKTCNILIFHYMNNRYLDHVIVGRPIVSFIYSRSGGLNQSPGQDDRVQTADIPSQKSYSINPCNPIEPFTEILLLNISFIKIVMWGSLFRSL